jgi:hypothetical protein
MERGNTGGIDNPIDTTCCVDRSEVGWATWWFRSLGDEDDDDEDDIDVGEVDEATGWGN